MNSGGPLASLSQPTATRITQAIEGLCHIPGPTGHEGKVRAYLEQSWSSWGLEPSTDRVGNLLAKVGGSGPRVLLQAHMDEIGYVVRHITDEGFLFLDSGQGGTRELVEPRYMVGQRALVLSREEVVAEGAIVAPSGHVLGLEGSKKLLTLSDFFLDVGRESREEVEQLGIHVGSPVVWTSETKIWGNRIVSKALDDRAGFAMMELVHERLNLSDLTCELWLGATVQEENSLHGARAMAAHEQFDAVLAIDIGLAGDIPVINPTEVETALGKGPVVVHQDASFAYHQELAWEVVDRGREAGIPVQHGMFTNYSSDAGAFLEGGSPSVVLGAPARYSHTVNEMMDLRDFDAAVSLVLAYLTGGKGGGKSA
ncbi:MAG TPA: M20/M25/M40 family metallo-hydrolase [Solirubrobacterales bacterium]|nr:M20/M25/M40 family metallo-hydrolase [Solirubrobacterales bacterium]